MELTPNICLIVVDGNAHKCAFSFVEFLKIQKNLQYILMETQLASLD